MTNIRDSISKKSPYAILVLVVIALELVFFRSMIFNNDYIIGNLGDSRLIALILEHWYRVFSGEHAIRDIPMFYPVKNTLGYSDTLFLISLPFSLLRATGVEWLSAYQITLISIHLFGGLSLAWLLRNKLGLPVWACVIGLIIGNYSNAYFIKLGHTQFITSSFVPLLFIFLYNFIQYAKQGKQRKRITYGILSIILFAGIMTTTVYIGYYTAIFLFIATITTLIKLHKSKKITITQILIHIRQNKIEAIVYVATAILSMLPFVWIYYPVFQDMGGRNWSNVVEFLPYWYDFFNVSANNLLWWFPGMSHSELSVGYPLITGITLIICSIYYFRTAQKEAPENITDNTYIAAGFCIGIAVVSLLLLRIDLSRADVFGFLGNTVESMGRSRESLEKFSLWSILYFTIPGVSALRAAGRFTQFLMLPAGIAIAIFLANRIRKEGKKHISYVLLITLLITVIFLEHQNTFPISAWTKTQLEDYLSEVSPPPDDLESFLLVNNTDDTFYMVHLDAMSIAKKYEINTINGYSGQFPHGWWYIHNMDRNGNYTDLSNWVDEHKLTNVYLYDYRNDLWIAYSEQALIELERQFNR